jgi:hypothetical protein
MTISVDRCDLRQMLALIDIYMDQYWELCPNKEDKETRLEFDQDDDFLNSMQEKYDERIK